MYFEPLERAVGLPSIGDPMLALGVSPLGWLIFLGIVLLLFGSRLPSLARSLGQSVVEFKKGMKELEDHSDEGAAPKDPH
jgi:sec-independent protein translocase protein TatA